MDHRIRADIEEEFLHALKIQQINLMELGRATGELGNTLQRSFGGIRQVIHDDNLVPCIEEFKNGVRTNVTGATGDENLHHCPFAEGARLCPCFLMVCG